MSKRLTGLTRVLAAATVVAVLMTPAVAYAQDAQAPTAPAPTSAPSVKELVDLMQSKTLQAFVARDPQTEGRYVAVLAIPNVQLMLVAADYERATDIAYWIYNDEFMTAYQQLNASPMATGKLLVEDILADGLVLVPGEGAVADAVTVGTTRQSFDGHFTAWDKDRDDDDPIGEVDYYKAFADADGRYTRLLGLLLEELKKTHQ